MSLPFTLICHFSLGGWKCTSSLTCHFSLGGWKCTSSLRCWLAGGRGDKNNKAQAPGVYVTSLYIMLSWSHNRNKEFCLLFWTVPKLIGHIWSWNIWKNIFGKSTEVCLEGTWKPVSLCRSLCLSIGMWWPEAWGLQVSGKVMPVGRFWFYFVQETLAHWPSAIVISKILLFSF